MIKLLNVVCGILFLLSSTSTYCYSPYYFGLDGHTVSTTFENDFGGNILKKNVLGATPFFGVNLNDMFSLEAAYFYLKSSRVSTLVSNDVAAGMPIPIVLEPITFKSWATLKGPNLTLLVISPTFRSVPVCFFTGIGISRIEANFYRKTLQHCMIKGSVTRRIHASKMLLNFMVGADYLISKDFSIRGKIGFINTQRLHAFSRDEIHNHLYIPEIRMKNSIIYTIGFKWGF